MQEGKDENDLILLKGFIMLNISIQPFHYKQDIPRIKEYFSFSFISARCSSLVLNYAIESFD